MTFYVVLIVRVLFGTDDVEPIVLCTCTVVLCTCDDVEPIVLCTCTVVLCTCTVVLCTCTVVSVYMYCCISVHVLLYQCTCTVVSVCMLLHFSYSDVLL